MRVLRQKKVVLEIAHVHPRALGGTDSIGNLTLACRRCNQAKGNRLLEEFLSDRPDLAKQIRAKLLTPLQDAAAVNATRYRIAQELESLGIPVAVSPAARPNLIAAGYICQKHTGSTPSASVKSIDSATQIYTH